MTLILLIATEPIIRVVNGRPDTDVKVILSILSMKLPLAALGPIFTSMFICQGKNQEYLWVVKNTFLVNLCLVPAAIYFFGAVGLSASILAVGVVHQYLFYIKRKEMVLQPAMIRIPEHV